MEPDHPTRILVVDDDAGIRALLADYLSAQGMTVECVRDGRELDRRLADFAPDLVIMDLMLPGEDGLALTRRIQSTTALPVLMLSARGEDIDRIVGLEVGADDYLAKPFNPRELLARIRAILRRRGGRAAKDSAPERDRYAFGPFHLDVAACRLLRAGEEIPLTPAEYSLLKIFVEHPNRALSRDQIMDWLKGFERDPFDRSIDVRVTRLRRKIEDDLANPVYLRTVWGQGYLFAPDGGRT